MHAAIALVWHRNAAKIWRKKRKISRCNELTWLASPVFSEFYFFHSLEIFFVFLRNLCQWGISWRKRLLGNPLAFSEHASEFNNVKHSAKLYELNLQNIFYVRSDLLWNSVADIQLFSLSKRNVTLDTVLFILSELGNTIYITRSNNNQKP